MNFKFRGKKIYYHSIGKGRPVIFLHGFGLDHSAYTSFFENFEDFKIYIPDLPGIGKSEALDHYSMEILADFLKCFMDELDLKSVPVIGHSLGGYIVSEFLSRHPERLDAILFLNSFCGQDTDQKKADRLKNIEFIKKYGVALYTKELITNLFSEKFKSTNKYFMDTLMFHSSQYSVAGVCGLIESMAGRADHCEVLKAATLPVCFVLGADDHVIPKKETLDQVVYPRFSTVYFPEHAHHMAPFESEVQTRSAIMGFLEEV